MPPKNGNGNGSEMSLYFHPSSFYSQKVVMAMRQKQLKFRPVCIDIQNGKQFTAKFLALNPRGEVPVLVDDVRVIPGSELILNYLEDNFSNGTPKLLPSNLDVKQRVEQLNDLIHALNVQALTFGSIVHDDLELNPKAPFDNPTNRKQIKTLVEQREGLLQGHIKKYPNHSESLSKKLHEIQEDSIIFQRRSKYEDLILSFEKVMDECEAEISSHGDNSWWLASPEISLADVSFSILLHRLWLLGFDKKMWGRSRPFIKRYFARVSQLESFKEATTIVIEDSIFKSPIFWGCIGLIFVAGVGIYLWHNKDDEGWGIFDFSTSDSEGSNPSPALPSSSKIVSKMLKRPPTPTRVRYPDPVDLAKPKDFLPVNNKK